MTSDNTHYTDLPELSFANSGTFLKAPRVDPQGLSADVDVAVFGAPYDGAVSRRPGTRYGPAALRAESGWYDHFAGVPGGAYNADLNAHVAHESLTIRDCGDVPTVPNSVERTYTQVRGYTRTVAKQAFPVLLGGDHYLTYPAFCGFADTVEADVGLIHLDAHSDTIADSDLYGDHWHGSPMARIDESTYGSYDNHAMVGIRGYESAGFPELVESTGLHVEYARDVQNDGIDSCLERAIAHATANTDVVYLTVDIDAADPSFAPGTGTPEPGGLSSAQLLAAMDRLGECSQIGAMDLMEVSPPLDDDSGTTAMLGAKAIVQFLESRFLTTE